MSNRPLRRIGWGPFRMPGEKKRMAALEAGYSLDHGQAIANLAGLVVQALMRYSRLDEATAYGYSIDVANALVVNPQVMRDVLDSMSEG